VTNVEYIEISQLIEKQLNSLKETLKVAENSEILDKAEFFVDMYKLFMKVVQSIGKNNIKTKIFLKGFVNNTVYYSDDWGNLIIVNMQVKKTEKVTMVLTNPDEFFEKLIKAGFKVYDNIQI